MKQNNPQLNLPIYKYKNTILQNIQSQSAIIISGLTGCGKSTQVPQYLLDHFPGASIAVCQPRRLAATSLALRVCQQRKAKLGSQVGYQIGLQTKRQERTRLVYMTYGILIQQLLFRQELDYDFIILDQVHERSLQMDFAFVILKKIINQKINQKIKRLNKKENLRQEQQPRDTKQNNINQKESTQKNQASKKNNKSTIKNIQNIEKQNQCIKKTNKNLKLIIMSATLNSEQFQRYFAIHKITNLIIEPKVVIRQEKQEKQENGRRRGTRQNQRRRGNTDSNILNQAKKEISITYSNIQDYREGVCIFIDEKNQYTVKQYYLQDFLPYFQIKPPNKNYEHKDEVRLDEKHYDWGVKLIEKAHRDIQYASKYASSQNKNGESGDILVFLPGLIEINRMKQTLIRENKNFQQKIVEVHSLFSEDLYFKLFKSTIKNKIILATNIGQSSITLPNCKVVIDYCLNRKAIKDSKQGISRFSTNVASLSNLIQRKGRVGRVSDGIVYRMITKQQFSKLDQFDVPQIKCVSLQMSILKTKKLQSTSKSQIFQDIYQIFLNVLQPPEIKSIQSAIDNLIHEDALQYGIDLFQQNSSSNRSNTQQIRKINSGKKYDGKKLKITKVGEFMVSMPCELGVSKLILMGIKLGISSIVIDIAAIILSTKSFFCHEQRRANIEQFMHSIIGYDHGDNNDYLLRQRLFDHWRSKFYIPFRNRQKSKLQENQLQKLKNIETSFRIFDFGQEIEFDQNYKIVDKFARTAQSGQEKDFCKNRGVYANHMRQLLRVSETLKIRIQMIGVQKTKLNTFQPQAQLVLICLMYAFPDIVCQVNFKLKGKQLSQFIKQVQKQGKNFRNKVYIPLVQGFNKRQLNQYLAPEKNFEYKQQKNQLMISSSDHILKKFLLPKNYVKSQSEYCSLLYSHCKSSKIKYPFQYNVYNGFSNITILNQSINKQILISKDIVNCSKVENKYLISNNLIESKGRYMVGTNAIISNFQLVIISMIVKKNVQLCLHQSKQFFSHIKIKQKIFQIPLLLQQIQLDMINKIRNLSKRKKQEEISSKQQQFDQNQLAILSALFKFQNRKPSQQQWQYLFIKEENEVMLQNQMKIKNSTKFSQKQFKQQLKKQQKYEQKKNTNKQQEQWGYSYQQSHSAYQHNKEQIKWIPIEQAQNQMKRINKNHKLYYQRYNSWKKYLLQQSARLYKIYSTVEAILICGYCNQKKAFTQISPATSFDFKSGLLKLNKFSGSWICPDVANNQVDKAGRKIYCSNKHHIGNSQGPDYATLYYQNINVYAPFNEIYPLISIQTVDDYAEIINQAKHQGIKNLQTQHQKFNQYQCKICYSKDNDRKVFARGQQLQKRRQKMVNYVKDPLWNLIINHLVSNQHINNKDKMKSSIISN